MIRYRLRLADPHRHLFEIETKISNPDEVQLLKMPSWIPGSYLLREFARHVVAVEADCAGETIAWSKVDKNTWAFSGATRELRVTMLVYALDESVRGAFFDTRRAYFNGPCVFCWAPGRENEPVELIIESGSHAATGQWRVATAMPAADTNSAGFGLYRAASYDELIDHPFEIGCFRYTEFDAGGVPHCIAIAGRIDTDIERIATDMRQLCETQIDFFGRPPPFGRYVFLGLATGSGYGGLEHRASSSLIFSRDDLPRVGEPGIPNGYRKFLGLVSHEYFHAWHIKQTKPDTFVPYRLSERNYTRQLWVFEGITSYYQELFLLRSGLIGVEAFLQRISETLTRVYRTPGRARQSLAQSSFDAWDVLYKPTPGTVNSGVSYYSKGALVALALDLTLRRDSSSRTSLDDVVRVLWKRFGSQGAGVAENGLEAVAEELGGEGLKSFFDKAVRGTEDIHLGTMLEEFGIQLTMRASAGSQDRGGDSAEAPDELELGATVQDVPRGVEITAVFDGGPAEQAGLNPGDVLVALDRIALDTRSLKRLLGRHEEGEAVSISAFRDGELIDRELILAKAAPTTCALKLLQSEDPEIIARRQAWLGE